MIVFFVVVIVVVVASVSLLSCTTCFLTYTIGFALLIVRLHGGLLLAMERFFVFVFVFLMMICQSIKNSLAVALVVVEGFFP